MDYKRTYMAESDSTLSVAISPSRMEFLSEDFRERECGEPLASQHVVLDFTPSVEDTPFMEKKCCAFWDLVRNSPELQNLMVVPEKVSFSKTESDSAQQPSPEPTSADPKASLTAVSVFEGLEERDVLKESFATRLPYTPCSVVSLECDKNKPQIALHKEKREHKRKEKKNFIKKEKIISDTKSSTEVKELCKKLQDWDVHHPKSMEPPSHPSQLGHCILQRNKP